MSQLSLFPMTPEVPPLGHTQESLLGELRLFRTFGKATLTSYTKVVLSHGLTVQVPSFTNEFWTSGQRAAHSLHEISYRACFKPQLPRFFVQRLTQPGSMVYDPFMGRGTTLLEAALLGRHVTGCDINPLALALVRPRFSPPTLKAVAERLGAIDFTDHDEFPEELLVFYHPDTLREICSLKKYLLTVEREGLLDTVDDWIRMVTLNRLTGHSRGFLSVYTMPPNQAVSVQSQRRINERRGQTPPRRALTQIVLTKSASLLRDCDQESRAALRRAKDSLVILSKDAAHTPEIPDGSIQLVVTSPPFLDVVDYAADNWLRCWFIGINALSVPISILKGLKEWVDKMKKVFQELHRILTPGGYVAFEVGEIRGGRVRLEEQVIPAATSAGLAPVLVLINNQRFTKTANCWGVTNNVKGTNSNRVVLLRKA